MKEPFVGSFFFVWVRGTTVFLIKLNQKGGARV